MTLPGGWGTRHAPLVWNVAEDLAMEAMDSLAAGSLTWGILFWIPLMRGGDDPAVLARWQEQASRVETVRVRADLVQIVLLFAELAGRSLAWSNALREWNMYESKLLMEWTADARWEAERTTRREVLLLTLKERFPDLLPEEVVGLINQQESGDLLRDWFRAALHAPSLEEFLAVLRR